MKFRDICEKLKTGEMTFDLCGHQPHGFWKESFFERYDKSLAFSNGANDGKWSSTPGEEPKVTDEQMRDHFKLKLDIDVKPGEPIVLCAESEECQGCGERLYWTMDGDKLSLSGYFKGNDFAVHPSDTVCPFTTPSPMTGEIRVSSKLIFVNFFRAIRDCDEKDEHTPAWSLCHTSGRRKITAYKAARNVAYGQMSNMSVGIFLHPERKSIIVGDLYIADHKMEAMSEEEVERVGYKKLAEELAVIDGHKLMGGICLDVWRWEATDRATIGEDEYRKVKKENRRGRGMVEIDVPHGVWGFEHYYDTNTSPDEAIYARLRLKGTLDG